MLIIYKKNYIDKNVSFFNNFKLKKKIPTHMTPITAWIENLNEKLKYWRDLNCRLRLI